MVRFTDVTNIKYLNKKYSIIKIPFKNIIYPVVLDREIYDKIKTYDKNWIITSNGTIYTLQNDNVLFLHEIVYILHYNHKNNYPIVHLNKIGLDNRIENLIEDCKNKQIKKNLNKKARTIKLENINVDKIPSFVWYLKEDSSHGDRFQVELGNIKWKCTSCDKLSTHYKLEETKKFLRQYKERNPLEFEQNSMNSDLNIHGVKCKKDFFKILEKCNIIYNYNIENNTSELLKQNLLLLNSLEKKLLREFDIDSTITTFERLSNLEKVNKMKSKK